MVKMANKPGQANHGKHAGLDHGDCVEQCCYRGGSDGSLGQPHMGGEHRCLDTEAQKAHDVEHQHQAIRLSPQESAVEEAAAVPLANDVHDGHKGKGSAAQGEGKIGFGCPHGTAGHGMHHQRHGRQGQ